MQINRRMFVRQAGITAGLTVVPGRHVHVLASALQSSDDSLLQRFRSPPKKFRPMVRWWWPGDDVNEAELRRELGSLDEAGFGGAEIQAFFKGLNRAELSAGQKERINGFASPSFFKHVRVAAAEARDRGMFIDYTLGSGWPFGGGAAISPELAAIELRWSHRSLQGPARFQSRLQIPSVADGDPASPPDALAGLPADWVAQMRKRTRIVAVVAMRGEDTQWSFYQTGSRGRGVMRPGRLEAGTAVDLTRNMREDGVLEWEVPQGSWQVFVFVSMPTGQRVNGAAGEGPQLVLDHLNAAAFRAHAARVGGAAASELGEYFGNGIRAMFCDSLEVRANLYWSDDFLVEFRRRRGYELLPYLPVLQVQTVAEPAGEFFDTPLFDIGREGAKVRRDYRQTVAELMKERFYDEFNRWAHEHKLLARTQAHGAPVDVLRVYGDADIPETEQLYDSGTYDFLKLASSAAHVRGRAIVGSESFVWPGRLYQTTPEELKRAVDELISAGVNAIVYHGFAYRIQGIAAPGWHPFSGINDSGNYSSQFNELNPLWPFFAKLNAYIARLQVISQSSKNIAAVAVFRDGLDHGAAELPPTPPLNQAMTDAGYDYDHVNGSMLLECSVHGGLLESSGGAKYGALIIPAKDTLDASVLERVGRFAEAGLQVIFVGDGAQQTRNVQELLHVPTIHWAAAIGDGVELLEHLVPPNVRFKGRPCFFLQQRAGNRNIFFLRNDSDAARSIDALFEAEGRPQLWDAWTGEIEDLAIIGRENGRVRIQVDLQPFGSALVVFSPGGTENAVASTRRTLSVRRVIPIGASGWRFTARGMMASGASMQFNREMPSLIDWSTDSELRGFCGRGTYRTSFSLQEVEQGRRLVLDLGSVKEVAEVSVNGRLITTLMLRPYETDVTEYLKPGVNTVDVSVTNTLFNCMMLRQPRPFRPDPGGNALGLMPGGLLGPVQLKVMG